MDYPDDNFTSRLEVQIPLPQVVPISNCSMCPKVLAVLGGLRKKHVNWDIIKNPCGGDEADMPEESHRGTVSVTRFGPVLTEKMGCLCHKPTRRLHVHSHAMVPFPR